MDESLLPGWYGKLPGMGDFAHRRLPDEFRHAWDRWLQGGLTQLRGRHADWTERYLQAPLWCFVLGEGVMDESSWIGVLMPSVDSVGRYFPFTVATQLEWAPTEIHGQVLARAQRWLQLAAQAAVDGLEQDLDAVRFDAVLLRLFGNPETAEAAADEAAGAGNIDAPPDGSETAMLVLPEYGASLWFTDPEAEGGQGMSTHGLPQDDQFDALFGFWAGATSAEDGQ